MHQFSSGGVRLAYIDVPSTGPDRDEPILLVHGFASNHAVNWVNTLWVRMLTHAGRRVIAPDNRGHGRSDKLYSPEDYETSRMAADAGALLDHLGLGPVDVMGYSMGARIAAFLAKDQPRHVRSLVLGGLGDHLVKGIGLPAGIADAMEAPTRENLSDPVQRMFRSFAETTGSDLRAMAACIRGSRQTLTANELSQIHCPVLVAVGSRDIVAGDGRALAAMFPMGRALEIPGRDHNLAVGDKVFKQGVLAFLEARS